MGITNLDRLDVNRLHLSGAALAFNAFSYDLYVNPAAPNADDDCDGDDPQNPLATLQGAVDRATELNVSGIRIFAAPGNYAESVVTPDYGSGPGYCEIIGLGHGQYSPYWESAAATTPCLSLNTPGWRVSGFRMAAPTTAACIELHHTDVSGNDIAINTIIENCHFYGQTTGLAGILTHGCYECVFRYCEFENFHNAGGTATAFLVGTTPLAIPYRNRIHDCLFYENDNHIDAAAQGMNGCMIYNNCLKEGYTYTPTIYIDTSIGDDNAIWGNFLGGTYSNAGGYLGGAADRWWGNYANVAGGITQAAPA